jgi:colanic acid biosynthesis glycosyl transferase WcaI
LQICVTTQYFWPESFRINDLVQALDAKGHQIRVLTGQPNYPDGVIKPGYRSLRPRWSRALGGEVLRVPIVARGNGSGGRLAANYLSFALSASLFGLASLRRPVDVVLAYEPSPVTVAVPALLLARRLKVPAVMWVQDLWPETLFATARISERWSRLAAAMTRKLHRSMDRLLVQSQAFIEPLIAQGVSPDKIAYLPNWAEDDFRPVEVLPSAPERADMPSGFVVMFAGNLGAAQGLEVLLGAAHHLRDLRDIHWAVLGDGRQAGWFRAEIEKRNLVNVHMLGQRSQESMPTWFGLADALLVTLSPGSVYELTVPSKLQAYLACGKPILASLDGEAARIIQAACAGLATPAGNARALADATLKLYRMSAHERAAMGRQGREYSERNFDRQMLIDRLESVLKQCAAGPLASPLPA